MKKNVIEMERKCNVAFDFSNGLRSVHKLVVQEDICSVATLCQTSPASWWSISINLPQSENIDSLNLLTTMCMENILTHLVVHWKEQLNIMWTNIVKLENLIVDR